MTSACSGALEMSITVLTDPDQNILIPSPGFGLYNCLGGARGLDCRPYRLVVGEGGRGVVRVRGEGGRGVVRVRGEGGEDREGVASVGEI